MDAGRHRHYVHPCLKRGSRRRAKRGPVCARGTATAGEAGTSSPGTGAEVKHGMDAHTGPEHCAQRVIAGKLHRVRRSPTRRSSPTPRPSRLPPQPAGLRGSRSCWRSQPRSRTPYCAASPRTGRTWPAARPYPGQGDAAHEVDAARTGDPGGAAPAGVG